MARNVTDEGAVTGIASGSNGVYAAGLSFDASPEERHRFDSVQEQSDDGEAVLTAADETQRTGIPEPGTEAFAELCRGLDHHSRGYRFLKRLFDIVFSLCVIVIGLIPGLLLSIAIAVDTKGSPIYLQVRVGKWGKPFRIYKFRTMVADSDDVEKYFTPEQLEVWKRERKVDNDPRVTRLGRVLRATSFDETAQFINVLLGQISVIGPRVITFDELEHFGNEKARLLSVTPGITGMWQTGERNLATFENGLRQKIELEYVQEANVLTDVRIFFKTFGVMFSKRTGR